MTVDLDAGPWTTSTLAMAHDVAAQGQMIIEVASMSPRPTPASLAAASHVVIDRPVAAYAMWSGSTLVATCRPPDRRQPVGVPMLIGGRRLARSSRFTRFVVGVDSTDTGSTIVVESASTLAAAVGASLTLVEILEPPSADVDVPDSAHLHHVGARLAHPPDDYDTVRASEPGRALLRYVGPRADTIIVLGYSASHRRRLLRRVLRGARCPVLIVPTGAFCS
jgi:nucleotide-binding universal stress UspA family protein